MRHLEGSLSKQIGLYKQELIDVAAILEAWVDFPDEGLEFASFDEIVATLKRLDRNMQQLLGTYHDGKIASEGLHIALVGAPNVGKSSLMNALLKKERAIVSPIAGTTRDLIEDHLLLNGLHIRLTDTAGIRSANDLIEEEGIKRSKKVLEEADVVLFLLDASLGITAEDRAIFPLIPAEKAIVIWNKIDLGDSASSLHFKQVVKTSALQAQGIEELKQAIDQIIWHKGPPSKEEILITSVRHHEALSHASLYVRQAYQGLETEISPEFITFDVRQALVHLGKIIGSDIQEDILSSIFSKFCVGK
jgi:tRNA modification GTPase